MLDHPPRTQPRPGAQLDEHPINAGLVAWYLMNEGAGTVLSDLRSEKAKANFNAATIPWKSHEGAYGIEVTTAQVADTASRTWGFGMPATLACWARADAGQVPLSIGYGNKFQNHNIYLVPGVAGYAVAHPHNDGGNHIWRTGGTVITVGSWHFYVATMFDSTLANTHIYVDGKLDDAGGYAVGACNIVDTTPRFVRIGGRVAGETFGGLVENARIWNRPLTAGEAWQVFSQRWIGLWQPSGRTYFGYGSYFVPQIISAIG